MSSPKLPGHSKWAQAKSPDEELAALATWATSGEKLSWLAYRRLSPYRHHNQVIVARERTLSSTFMKLMYES